MLLPFFSYVRAGACALGIALSAGGAASAADVPAPPIRVVVGDLDLARPADVLRLRARVEDAVRAACAEAGPLDFLERSACYSQVRFEILQALPGTQRRAVLARSSPSVWPTQL